MNKGLLQNSNVQQMITTINPSSLWNINNIMRPPFIPSSPSSSSSTTINNYLAPPPNNNNNYIINPNHSTNYTINNLFQVHQYNNMNMNMASYDDNHVQEQPPPFHESLSQLLLDGLLMGEEEKKMENWEEQIGLQQHHSIVEHLKQENSLNSYNNNNNNNYNNIYSTNEQEIKQVGKSTNWSSPHQISISSPQSCVSTNFIPVSDHSSECDSTPTSGALKKPKLQPSPSRSTFKVRKEKLGDRITALHQLVSPFGKTDTASVLLEAIGYVRFLHGQIEALSLPYLTNEAGNKRQPHIVQGEKKCIFPEDPGQDSYKEEKDLRSKGLCLVPLSCTVNVGTNNGADYWAPAISGGGFR